MFNNMLMSMLTTPLGDTNEHERWDNRPFINTWPEREIKTEKHTEIEEHGENLEIPRHYTEKPRENIEMPRYHTEEQRGNLEMPRYHTEEQRGNLEKPRHHTEEQRGNLDMLRHHTGKQRGNLDMPRCHTEEQRGNTEMLRRHTEEQRGNLDILRHHTDEQRGNLDMPRCHIEEQRENLELSRYNRKHTSCIKRKRIRTAFSTSQLQYLEIEFSKKPYVTREERNILSNKLNIGDRQIKVWYQNRRMRQKRELNDNAVSGVVPDSTGSQTVPAPGAILVNGLIFQRLVEPVASTESNHDNNLENSGSVSSSPTASTSEIIQQPTLSPVAPVDLSQCVPVARTEHNDNNIVVISSSESTGSGPSSPNMINHGHFHSNFTTNPVNPSENLIYCNTSNYQDISSDSNRSNSSSPANYSLGHVQDYQNHYQPMQHPTYTMPNLQNQNMYPQQVMQCWNTWQSSCQPSTSSGYNCFNYPVNYSQVPQYQSQPEPEREHHSKYITNFHGSNIYTEEKRNN